MTTPFVSWMEALTPGNPVAQIANVHTTFNIVTTLILLPFGNVMARIATQILPDSKKRRRWRLQTQVHHTVESNYAIGSSAVALHRFGMKSRECAIWYRRILQKHMMF